MKTENHVTVPKVNINQQSILKKLENFKTYLQFVIFCNIKKENLNLDYKKKTILKINKIEWRKNKKWRIQERLSREIYFHSRKVYGEDGRMKRWILREAWVSKLPSLIFWKSRLRGQQRWRSWAFLGLRRSLRIQSSPKHTRKYRFHNITNVFC